MKTLVIHPADYSTDFLNVIYKDKDVTLVTDKFSKSKLRRLISEHDVIMMMGHGCERGLMNEDYNSVIDSNYVYLLRDKISVAIWCNADVFFKKYGLKGFYTGMIISETMEANLYCIDATFQEICDSNDLFAESIAKNLDINDIEKSVSLIKEAYSLETNVAQFNKEKIYFQ